MDKRTALTLTAAVTTSVGIALGAAVLTSAAPALDQERVNFMGYCVPSQVDAYAAMNDDNITTDEAIDRCATLPGDEAAYAEWLVQVSPENF